MSASLQLRHRLRKDHHDDLAKEVENISKAYEDMSEQNSRLLSQVLSALEMQGEGALPPCRHLSLTLRALPPRTLPALPSPDPSGNPPPPSDRPNLPGCPPPPPPPPAVRSQIEAFRTTQTSVLHWEYQPDCFSALMDPPPPKAQASNHNSQNAMRQPQKS